MNSQQRRDTPDMQNSTAKPLVLTVKNDCRLTGASHPLINALQQQLTIDNPKYRAAKKYGRWVSKKLAPRLFFYETNAGAICFPRGFANRAIRLCRQYMSQSPRIIDQRRLLPETAYLFKGKLRPYQQEAVNNILRSQFGVLEAGTGSGKTVMALAVAAARRQPTLVLLHSRELMYQWQDRAKTFLDTDVGIIGDGSYSIKPFSVGIVNTVRKHLGDLPHRFGHLIVDECHRVPASLFTTAVSAFDCCYTLGLSATAYRRDDGLTKLIYFYMGDRAAAVDAEELHAAGAVLRPKFIQRPTEFQYRFSGDYAALLTALTKDHARNRQIADDIVAATKNNAGTVLVVSDRVAHCETLAGLLTDNGVNVAVLTGRLPAKKRSAIVAAVRTGGIQVLISTLQLIGEGFDCPGLTTLFLTTPIKFTGRLLQVVGRILRPATGKEPKVFDYVDPIGVLGASARARLQTCRIRLNPPTDINSPQ